MLYNIQKLVKSDALKQEKYIFIKNTVNIAKYIL